MQPEFIGLIGIGILILFLAIGMPVALSMLISGFFGTIFLTSTEAALSKLAIETFASVKSYSLSVIPLFLFMGQLLSYSGLAKDIYSVVNMWIGRIRAGLALSAICASAIFGMVCGSIIGTAVTICSVALPQMRNYGYKADFSAACIASSAGLGVLIPPSTLLVLYGVLTQEPIGKLLIAGIMPGVILTFLLMVTTWIWAKLSPDLAPQSFMEKVSFRTKVFAFSKIIPVLFLFLMVIGGIYLGIFSPTEGAAFGAFCAFVFALARKEFNYKGFSSSLADSVRVSAMIFLIVVGANIFGTFMAMSKIPLEVVELVNRFHLNKYLIMGALYIFYTILGTFMEGLAIMVLTIPIVYPLVLSLGFSGIWFGPIMVVLLSIGTITPPVGLIVYIVAGQARDIPMEDIFKKTLPYLFSMLISLLVLTLFPGIVTFLPEMMK
jgi:tripartite ATP-independent transporter DctM subunit